MVNEVLTRLDVPFYTRKGYQKNYLGPAMYSISEIWVSVMEITSKWELQQKRMRENLSLPCIMKKDMIIILSTFCS